MATSGSVDYNVTGTAIVIEAMELIGAIAAGETLTAHDGASCLRSLEMMIKHWQAEGIGLWRNKEAALFLSYEGYSFSVGPTGDHCSTTWVKTEIATAASSGDATITVDDDTGVLDGDYIGVELDDYSLQWTTVDGDPVANVITLDAVLTDDVAVDNHVYTYTTLISRPLEIIEARLHRASGSDIPMKIISLDEYTRLSTKTTTGVPNQIYYDPQQINIKVKIWPACNDVQDYIKVIFRLAIEDVDALTNNADFGQEWLLPLAWNLAVLIAPKFGVNFSQANLYLAREMKKNASNFDMEQTSVFFESNLSGY